VLESRARARLEAPSDETDSHPEAHAFRSGKFKTFKSFNTFKLFNEPISLGRLERFERLELLEPAARSILSVLCG